MADVTYSIKVQLDKDGNFDNAISNSQSKLASMDTSVSKIGSGLKNIAGTMSDVFTGAVEKAAQLSFKVLEIGAGFAGAAATFGLKFNQEIEHTQMSFAAIFGANGVTKDMNSGMELASNMIQKIREDSEKLPVSFQEVATIMKTVAVAGFRTGAGAEQVEKLATSTALFANIENISGAIAGRQMSNILLGHATVSNTLAMRLGLNAKALKDASPAERLEMVNKALEGYTKNSEVFAHGFKALWTTFKNDVQFGILGPATSPLYGEIKKALTEINSFFVTNKAEVHRWAEGIGSKLADAFVFAKMKLHEWLPILTSFATDATHKLKNMWTTIEPIVVKIFGHIREAMKDVDGTFSKIGKVLEIYTALKIGGPLAGPLSQMAMGLGPVGMAVAGTGVAAGAMMAKAIADNPDAAKKADEAMVHFNGSLHKLEETWKRIEPAANALVDTLGSNMVTALNEYASFVEQMTTLYRDIAHGFGKMMDSIENKVESWANRVGTSIYSEGKEGHSKGVKEILDIYRKGAADLYKKDHSGSASDKEITGGGGTNIQKVEIVVQQQGDPERVARAVMDKMADLSRFRKSSPFANNYAASVRR